MMKKTREDRKIKRKMLINAWQHITYSVYARSVSFECQNNKKNYTLEKKNMTFTNGSFHLFTYSYIPK